MERIHRRTLPRQKSALDKWNRNKVAGADGIIIEMLTTLYDINIEKITNILNEIFNSGDIPEQRSRSVYIEKPKI